ncbi:MAG: HEAT repeat domain-containing protein [Methanolobus sp.]|nr:HEAT repeat domain-containing protein [Methanolobus sp.]
MSTNKKHDIESLIEENDFQNIVNILKDEKIKGKVLTEIEIAVSKIIDSLEMEFIITNLKAENDKIKEVILYSILEGHRNIDNEESLIQLLLEFLNSTNITIVNYSASLLGSIKEERVVEPLIKLLSHKNFAIRTSASSSLGCIGDSRAIEPLLHCLYKEKDDEVKECIIESLKTFNHKKVNDELDTYFESLIPNHLKEVTHAFNSFESPQNIENIAKYLKDDNVEVREYAAERFYELKDERAIDALIESLHDKSKKVQYNAALALGKLNTPEAIGVLISNLENEDESIVNNAVCGLGKSQNKSIDKILYELVIDESHCGSSVALHICEHSDFFYNDDNFEYFIQILKCERIHARMHAITGLAYMHDKKAIPFLIPALNDEDIRNRQRAIYGFKNKGEEAIEPLVQILEDENTFKNKKLLRATVSALSTIDNPKIIDILIKALSIKDVYVRITVCEALGKRKDSKSIEALKECCFDENEKVVDAAKQALKELSKN